MKILSNIILSLVSIALMVSCNEAMKYDPFPKEDNPWHSIRKERIEKLLPDAMKNAGIDFWLTLCRENNNDPLAKFIGGENAVSSAAFIFINNDSGFISVVISGPGESTALKEIGLHDEIIVPEKGSSLNKELLKLISEVDPKTIAVNSSQKNITDGLSYTQRVELEKLLGDEYSKRLVSSDELVYEWLSIKLPAEIELMSKAAKITAQMQIDAYKTVVPGVTRDSDIAAYLKSRMKEIGVTDAWSPDQNPSVNSGPDRGHSHATDKVIQPGDVIQIDFGIKVYDMWCTDIQRFAYVLKPGETKAPNDIQKYFNAAINGHRKALEAMKPGVTGYSVDKTQRIWLTENGSLPILWGTGHPVGYWAHDIGPALSGAARSDNPYGRSAKILKEGMVFAYDGFFCWQLDSTHTKTFSVEEMAVIKEDKAEYLLEPQENLILIR
jgi:Xaa-Pro aminopeptidase